MKWYEFVGLVGSVASIIGAFVAWWQAAKATTEAQAATAAKLAILQRSAELSLSALYNEACQARETTRTLASGRRALRGFDIKQMHARVHELSDHIDENIHHAPSQEQAGLQRATARIRVLLQDLKSGKGDDRSEPPAAELHRVVAGAAATLRRAIDHGAVN